MISHDKVYIYNGIWRIRDHSVIVKKKSRQETYFNVCEDGVFDHMQTSVPETFIFIKTDHSKILNYRDWKNLNKDEADTQIKTYKAYMQEFAQDSVYLHEIIIPAREDQKTYGSSKNGMTGGIGSDRRFKLDIKKGALRQIGKKKVK